MLLCRFWVQPNIQYIVVQSTCRIRAKNLHEKRSFLSDNAHVGIAQPNPLLRPFDLEHPAHVCKRVEEPLVVGYEHESAGAMTQHVLQGLDRAYIQMVRQIW